MPLLLKAARWGAACLVVASTGCVKVEADPPPGKFLCEEGLVPVSVGNDWTCKAPTDIGFVAQHADNAETAPDAGFADYADSVGTATVADSFTQTLFTFQLGVTDPANAGQIVVNAPFLIQGFPVPSRRPLITLKQADVAPGESLDLTSVDVNPPPLSMVHFVVAGTLTSTESNGSYVRCDLVAYDTDVNAPLAKFDVSADVNGAAVFFERSIAAPDVLKIALVNDDGFGNARHCLVKNFGDLRLALEVVR